MPRLTLNEKYEIEFPSGTSVKAELYYIQTYPASGMPPDYHFRTLKGEVNPFSSSTADMFKPDEFPLPEFVLGSTKFTPLNGFKAPEENEVFDKLCERLSTINPSLESNYMEVHATLGATVKELDAKGELSTDQKMAWDDATASLISKLEKLKSDLENG